MANSAWPTPQERFKLLQRRDKYVGEFKEQVFLSFFQKVLEAGLQAGLTGRMEAWVGTEVEGVGMVGAAMVRGEICRSGQGQRHLHIGYKFQGAITSL